MQNFVDQSASSRQLQDTLRHMTLALSCVAEAIVWTDGNGLIQWCNAAFGRLVNRTAAALVEQPLIECLPLRVTEQPLALHPVLWSLANQQPCEGDYCFHRDDHSFLLALSVTPLAASDDSHHANGQAYDDRPETQGVLLVIRDITTPQLQPPALEQQLLALDETVHVPTGALSDPSRQARRRLETITDAFFLLDDRWCFTYLNHQAEQLLQRSHVDLMGQSVWTSVPEVMSATVDSESPRTIDKPCDSAFETAFETFYTPLNVWFEVRTYPIAQGLAVYFQDISERKRIEIERQCTEAALRESEQWFRSVFEATSVGMMITLTDGSLLQPNAAYCQMLGYTQAELLATTCQQVVHPDDFERGQRLRQQLLSGERSTYHLEQRYIHKQGHLVWGLLSVSAVRNVQQEALYVVYQIQDITDRKQAEAALHQLNQELEQRVHNRTAQLEAVNQQLQTAIAEHQQTEAALRTSEERFRIIFDHAPIAISLVDAYTCRMVKVNQAHHALLGYSKAELAAMTFVDFTHPDDVDRDVDHIHQLLDGSIARFQIEKRFIKKNGDWIWANLTVALVRDPDGGVYSMGMIEDITVRKQTEAALQLTQFSIDRSTDPIWWVRSDGTITYVNDAACRELGYERDAIVGQQVSRFNPDFHAENWSAHWQEMKQRRAFTFETRNRAKNGAIFPVEVTVNYLELNNKEFHCSFVRNITDRKRADDQLKASLKEKEILLKEVHHRVKNNLQTVYSLLNLQANAIQDPQILSPFKDSQHRVKTMALIHEKLYQSESLARINFDDYVRHLVADLVHSYSSNPANIHVALNIAELELSVDTVLPCGFIINELISNALKYAFPSDRVGTIQICFALTPTHHCQLVIADNGIGIPESIALPDTSCLSSTLGLQLVQAFVQQLRGTITLDRTSGSRFEISFPHTA